MNEHRGYCKRVAARPFGRTVSLLLLGAVACWLIAANLGCGGEWWEGLKSYHIRFTWPGSITITQPGQRGVSRATLYGPDDEDTGPYTATSWRVAGWPPPILANVHLSPTSDSADTTISWTVTSDERLFAPESLFAATVDEAYQLGVEARYVKRGWSDAAWSSVTAYLPIKLNVPRIRARVTEARTRLFDPPYTARCSIEFDVTNPLEGARYQNKQTCFVAYYDGQTTRLWERHEAEWADLSLAGLEALTVTVETREESPFPITYLFCIFRTRIVLGERSLTPEPAFVSLRFDVWDDF